MGIYKDTYNINKIKDDKFLAYTHLGLGDHIVCNGLLNHFSESFNKIYLPVKSRDLNNVNYLYKDTNKIEVFKIEHETEVEDISSFAKKNNLTILKVGFKKESHLLICLSMNNLIYHIIIHSINLKLQETKKKKKVY